MRNYDMQPSTVKHRTILWMALILSVIAVLFAWRSSSRPPSVSNAADSGDTLARVLKEKRLRVGYINSPPMNFPNPQTGEREGLFIDIVSAIVNELDPSIQVTYEETTWADFAAALNSGRIDLSIVGTFTTIPRAKVVSFTRPLMYSGRSVIIRKGDTRFSAEKGPMQFDRPDIKIGVADGEGSHEFVRTHFKNQQNLIVFSGGDLSECLTAVSAGQVDVGMSDALRTERYSKAHQEVTDLYADKPYDLTPVAWAVRHDDVTWREFLNTAIDLFEAQGKLEEFEKRYDYRWVQPVREFRKR
jgi:ABC-type amino acid transport substrate-binding protein